MKTNEIHKWMLGLMLASFCLFSTGAQAQLFSSRENPMRLHRDMGKRQNRQARDNAITGPVAMNEKAGHDPKLDMYEPTPGGVMEANKKVNKKAMHSENKSLKKAQRKERRMAKMEYRRKAKKDKMALGRGNASKKNADPRKLRINHR